MTNPTIRIHDLATNKVVDREMNDEEFATYEADKAIQAAENAALVQTAVIPPILFFFL